MMYSWSCSYFDSAAASKRAQAACGARNSHTHRVPGQPSEGRPLDGLMDIERTLKLGRQRGTGFRPLLESSKCFGYRFLDVKWINFRIPKSIEPLKEFGKELGSEVCDQNLRMVSKIILRPGYRGGIKVIEVEVWVPLAFDGRCTLSRCKTNT